MAVETRFVVVRGGNEIMTFADKKAADEYDRMLDMADNITTLLNSTELDFNDKQREDLGIYLAKNREEVLIALLAKKRPAVAEPVEAAKKPASSSETSAEKPARKKRATAKEA